MLMRAGIVAGCLIGFAGLSGCESTPTPQQLQPPINELHTGDRGVQAKNVQEMTDAMLRSMSLKVAEFNAQNPNTITVVVYPVSSKDGRDYSILTKRLQMLLMRNNNAHITFTDDVDFLKAVQNREFGPNGNALPAGRRLPQFVLYADVETMRNHATSLYFCSFRLTRIMPDGRGGEVAWGDFYELNALN